MIKLNNIERSYKTAAGQTWVLRRINLEIRQGEFVTSWDHPERGSPPS